MKKNIITITIISLLIMGLIFIFFLHFYPKRTKTYELNEVIRLTLHQRAKVEDLNIYLNSISDSTCKEGMQCIWQGEYLYELVINKDRITLGTETAKEYNYNNYNIVLEESTSNKYILFKVNKNKQ